MNKFKETIDRLMNIAGIRYENHQDISSVTQEDGQAVYTTRAKDCTVTVRQDRENPRACRLSVRKDDGTVLADTFVKDTEEYLPEELEKVFDPENYTPWMH